MDIELGLTNFFSAFLKFKRFRISKGLYLSDFIKLISFSSKFNHFNFNSINIIVVELYFEGFFSVSCSDMEYFIFVVFFQEKDLKICCFLAPYDLEFVDGN